MNLMSLMGACALSLLSGLSPKSMISYNGTTVSCSHGQNFSLNFRNDRVQVSNTETTGINVLYCKFQDVDNYSLSLYQDSGSNFVSYFADLSVEDNGVGFIDNYSYNSTTEKLLVWRYYFVNGYQFAYDFFNSSDVYVNVYDRNPNSYFTFNEEDLLTSTTGNFDLFYSSDISDNLPDGESFTSYFRTAYYPLNYSSAMTYYYAYSDLCYLTVLPFGEYFEYTGFNPIYTINVTFNFSRYYNSSYLSESYEDGYDNGYGDGYSEGYGVGNEEGFAEGDTTGYQRGFVDGANSAEYGFTNLFGSIADTPVLMIRSLFNFDLFGINLLSVILSLFTALIVFYLLRKLL